MNRLRWLSVLVLLASACLSDAIALERGPLGPARYAVRLQVTGRPAVLDEALHAELVVDERGGDATLRLRVEDDDALVVRILSRASGRLELDTVQGVSPSSAGEADLASLVDQLDPPLPPGPVRPGERWSRVRSIETDTLRARLRSRLRIVGFRRVAGSDAVQIAGTVTGRLRAAGPTGVFEGAVRGTTVLTWLVHQGRLGSSETELVWTIDGTGDIVLRTEVAPLT